MKLICVFPTNKGIPPTRLLDTKSLGLPTVLEQEFSKIIHINRMLYEPWIQSSKNYAELIELLRKKGYKNLPMTCSPLHDPLTVTPKIEKSPMAKTMLRKKI